MKLNLVFELDQKVVKFGICFLPKPKGFTNMKNQAQTHTRKAYLKPKRERESLVWKPGPEVLLLNWPTLVPKYAGK
jgi:hypothetical protein